MTEKNNYNSDKKKVSIKNLFLDPNNYRFIDNKNYKVVPPQEIHLENIQRRTLNFLVGEKRKGIEDLLKSFQANGFLAVDQIQVESLGDGKYRVLEGNRRVAALKTLYQDYKEQSADLGNLLPDVFSSVPIVVYNGQMAGEHEIIMGLKHISGNKKWPPLNQAQLIFDLINKYDWSEEKACESLGISKHELRRSLRTIALIQDYRQSDFGDQFSTDMFSLFRETVASQNLKSWIEWDDKEKKPTNNENAERLFSWFSSVTETTIDEDGEEINVEREPIITKSTEISILSKIIQDQDAITELEEKRNITDAYSASASVGDDKYAKAIANIEHNIEDAASFVKYAKEFKEQKIVDLKNKLEGLLVSQGHKDIVITKGISKRVLINCESTQFSSINLAQYKSFTNNLEIKDLNRINIFAGENNIGKSSLLEAIYLLANLNDINSLIELYRRRGKFMDTLPVKWLVDEFVNFNLEAQFDNKQVKVDAKLDIENDANIEKSDYLKTLYINASFNGGKTTTSRARLFQRKEMEQFYKEIQSVCAATYSSPFTMLGKELINYYHENSVQQGTYDKIIEFISNHVDPKIENITKVGDSDQIRFLVKHADFSKLVDLTQFGEGLQRIFYISLQLAAAQNGIMCIDEIENAIHHSLLVKFTGFIQMLAEEFNVQLFITTHSNECIKAFFENEYKNEQISGYRLYNSEEGVLYKTAKGELFQNQIQNFNLDLRG